MFTKMNLDSIEKEVEVVEANCAFGEEDLEGQPIGYITMKCETLDSDIEQIIIIRKKRSEDDPS